MAPPLRHAVTHEAQTQRRGLSLAAAAAAPTGGQRGERGSSGRVPAVRCAPRCRRRCRQVRRWRCRVSMPPVEQRPPPAGTLVRHVMCVVAPAGTRSTALAPAPRALRVQPCGRATSAGSAARPGAAHLHGPGAGTAGRNSGCRGRSGCTERPGRGNARTGTAGRVGPCAPRTQPKCWTDSPQRATLLWHRLHRHGVGRGTVVKLPGERDRCRAHLLRHRSRCTPPTATPLGLSWPPCRAARQTPHSSINCSARHATSRCRMNVSDQIRVLTIT